jgi:serine/threonine protein kinase
MATVYRAWDTRLQVHRAVKLLSPNLTHSGNIVERFLNEARAMARLHHPNIVAVHDVVSDGERSFIVLELVPGGSLRDWLDRHGAMPPRLAARTSIGILEALQAAHEAGVVHRDIKPQNILVSEKNQPMVTDFGIARFMGEDRSLTRTGSIMGTWGFMAPEQKTSAKSVDGRADVYAVGATLFTLLTNELPSDLFAADMDDELLGSLEPQLRDVVRHATRYRPEERYQSAAEFAETLRLLMPGCLKIPPATPALAKASTLLTTPPRSTKSALGNAGNTMEHMVSGGRENTIVPGGGESLRRMPGSYAQDGTGLTSFEERAQPLAQRLFFGVSAFMFVVGLAAVVWTLFLRPPPRGRGAAHGGRDDAARRRRRSPP